MLSKVSDKLQLMSSLSALNLRALREGIEQVLELRAEVLVNKQKH